MLLVVGATGQVGSAVVRQVAPGGPVRALVRPASNVDPLRALDVELVVGDLLDPGSLPAAVAGVDAIVATANTVAPRPRSQFGRVETEGYPALIRAARDAGVRRFVYLSSTSMGEWDARIPMQQHKRAVESALEFSGLEYSILRFPKFTDIWLAMPGSSIPLRGEPNATLARDYWFTKLYRRATGSTIEKRGRMVVPGPADRRNSFISVRDVARFLVVAIDHEALKNRVLEVGGAEALTWADVAAIYSRLLEREVRVTSAPGRPFRVLASLLRPIDGAASSLMALNAYDAEHATERSGEELAKQLGLWPLQTVEEFLLERLAMPA